MLCSDLWAAIHPSAPPGKGHPPAWLAAVYACSAGMPCSWGQTMALQDVLSDVWLSVCRSRRCIQLGVHVACRYSLVLVQREVAKNDLLLVALDIESAEAAAEAAAGDRRMMDLRQQVWDAESELNKAQTEGPANHRKRDHLDKVGCPLACSALQLAPNGTRETLMQRLNVVSGLLQRFADRVCLLHANA